MAQILSLKPCTNLQKISSNDNILVILDQRLYFRYRLDKNQIYCSSKRLTANNCAQKKLSNTCCSWVILE